MSVNRLGKGIGALIRSKDEQKESKISNQNISEISVEKIKPNPNQPRTYFDESLLNELASSISEKGIMTPITVRKHEGGYELIAGERRLRAAKRAKKETIPAYTVNVNSKKDIMEMALIENIQREDLNALEESNAYAVLNKMHGMSHTAIAKAVGKKRATISNSLRLLKLPESIKDSLIAGQISAGHARAILQKKNIKSMIRFWKTIVDNNLSVRQSEGLVKEINIQKGKKVKRSDPYFKAIENRLIELLGTKVIIKNSKKGGLIEVSYFSHDDLERIIELLELVND